MGFLADLILGKAKRMPHVDFEKVKDLSDEEVRELAESHIVEGRQEQKTLGVFVLFLLNRIDELEKRRIDELEQRVTRVELELNIDPFEDDEEPGESAEQSAEDEDV